MKRILFSSFIAGLLLNSCNKNNLNEINAYSPNPKGTSLVKYLNSYTALNPSTASPANGPTINYFLNGVKMNATALSYSGIYPVVGGGYATAPGGQVTIKAVLSRASGVNVPSDTIAGGNFLLGPNVAHSVILVDTFPNPTPFNPIMMVVQESVSMPEYGKFKIRLLNLVATNEVYELYNSTTATILTSGISFKNMSPWIELPTSTPSSVYQIRLAGTTTVMATSAALLGGNQRSYTFWARGNPSVSGRTRTLSSYVSQ